MYVTANVETINKIKASEVKIQIWIFTYQSNLMFLPPKSPQTEITPKMLKTAEPTMVPMPKSFLVTKVPITLAKNSGELVPKMQIEFDEYKK